MQNEREVRRFALWSSLLLVVIVIAFFARITYFFEVLDSPDNLKSLFIDIISMIGSVMLVWTIFTLYLENDKKQLVKRFFYKYMRHPMYVGVLLMDVRHWFVEKYDFFFWMTAAVLYVSIFIATRIEENEMVAKFGDEAVEYYGKTPNIPRIPFSR